MKILLLTAHATTVTGQDTLIPLTRTRSAGLYGAGQWSTSPVTEFMQTFTIGITGDIVSLRVQMAFFATVNFNLTLSIIVSSTSGAIGATPASFTITPDQITSFEPSNPQLFELDFDGIDVTEGDTLGMLFTVPDNPSGIYAALFDTGGNTNGYAGGAAYHSLDGGPFTRTIATGDRDIVFQTLVDAAVPLPTSGAAMLAGVGVLMRLRRRSCSG